MPRFRVKPPKMPKLKGRIMALVMDGYEIARHIIQHGRLTPFDSLTVTRATTATYFDSAGVMQTAAVNEARTDYDPATGALRGLLIEEARTNPVTYSEDATNAAWLKGNCTVDGDAAAAPNGSMTMDRINVTPGYGYHRIANGAFNIAGGTKFTATAFVKSDGSDYAVLTVPDATESHIAMLAHLATETVVDTDVGTTAGIIYKTDVKNCGGGIYRLRMTGEIQTGGGTLWLYVGACETDSPTWDSVGNAEYTATEGSDLFCWGMQLEVGDSESSYIPNLSTGSTQRNADVIQVTDLTDFSYNAVESTFLSTVTVNGPEIGFNVIFETHGGVSTQRLLNYLSFTGANWASNVRNASDSLNTASTKAVVAGVENRVASGFKLDDFPITVDGETTVQIGTNVMPVVNTLNIGSSYADDAHFNGHIKELVYYPRRLSNEALEAYSAGGLELHLHRFVKAQFYAYNAHGDDVTAAGYFNWLRREIQPGAGMLVWNDANDVTWVYCTSNDGTTVVVSSGSDLDGAGDPGTGGPTSQPPRDDSALFDRHRFYPVVDPTTDQIAFGFYNGLGLDHYITNETGDPDTAHQYLSFIADTYGYRDGDLVFVTGDAGGITEGDGLHRWLFNCWETTGYFDDFGVEYPYVDRT